MDAVASSTGTAIAGDRSGKGPLVIVVGRGFQHRATGAATAQLAGQVMVVVLGAWPVRVLPAGGPLPARLAWTSPGWPWTAVALCCRRGTWRGLPAWCRPVVAATRPRKPNPRRWGFPLRLPRPRSPGTCSAAKASTGRSPTRARWCACGTPRACATWPGCWPIPAGSSTPSTWRRPTAGQGRWRRWGHGVGPALGSWRCGPTWGMRGRCWTPPPRPPTRPGWASCERSWRRPRAATTRPAPPGHERSWTSWSPSWPGRWGWAAGTAGRRPTPSGPG